MGVDGISKADIFDEYFDDDKPKVTNFQRIKSMDIDEMAEFLNNFRRIPKCDYCIYKNDYDDCHADFCYKATKPWLESEVRK